MERNDIATSADQPQGQPRRIGIFLTGSVVFAAAGLLRGRPATSNFVDDGDVITAAGLSAGISMALHVVSRLAGPERAREVREGIEYAPDPAHRPVPAARNRKQ